MSTTAHYVEDGKYCCTTDDLDAIRGILAQRGKRTVWIDSDESSEEVASLFASLGLPSLVVEDIFDEQPLPKVESDQGYLYLVMHGVRRDAASPSSLDTIEMDILLGEGWVVTHRSGSMRSVEGLANELARSQRLLGRGPVHVMHAILDRLADHYAPVVDQFDDELDDVAEAVLDDAGEELLTRLFQMRRSLQRLRRVSTRQRDVLLRLAQGEFDWIKKRDLLLFRSIHDRFLRVADQADAFRETLTAALEMHMSVTARRTNEVMKALALISTVMLPLTFVAGVYGMNFDEMPGLHWDHGFAAVVGGMVLVAVLMVWLFRMRRWL